MPWQSSQRQLRYRPASSLWTAFVAIAVGLSLIGNLKHASDEAVTTLSSFQSIKNNNRNGNHNKRPFSFSFYKNVTVAELVKQQEQQKQQKQQQQQQQQQASFVSSILPVIDILSVGTLSRPELQQAQRETIGSHYDVVRHFYAATERDDVESNCWTNLTKFHVAKIIKFCRSQQHQYPFLTQMAPTTFQYKKKKGIAPGWVCAQKRPIQALATKMMTLVRHRRQQQQQQSQPDLPDYLFILDDDTWINLFILVPKLLQRYPSHQPWAIAGCLIRTSSFPFTFPNGGFGIIFTKATLQRWLQPLYCNTTTTISLDAYFDQSDDDNQDHSLKTFQTMACARLQQNLAGERDVFENGMTLVDLALAYSTRFEYLQINQWTRSSSKKIRNHQQQQPSLPPPTGFCFHSDWFWGYWGNYYHTARHANHSYYYHRKKTSSRPLSHDRWVGYEHSEFYLGKGQRRQEHRHCSNLHDKRCLSSSPLCHGISDKHMRFLHQQQQQQQQANRPSSSFS